MVADCLTVGAMLMFKAARFARSDDDTSSDDETFVPEGSEILPGVTLTPEALDMIDEPKPPPEPAARKPLAGSVEERVARVRGDWGDVG